MKKIPSTLLLFSLLVFTCSPGEAQSLQDEYIILTTHRSELEKRALELRKVLETLERKTLKLEELWSACANGRWRFVWNSVVAIANENRDALEVQRSRLFALNKMLNTLNSNLDQERRKIEHDFPIKGFEYEATFRKFMSKFENDYLFVLENEYFYGIERYLSGVKIYHIFVEYSIQACTNNDVSPIAIEQGLRYAKEIVDVVKSLKDLIKGVTKPV